MKSPFRVVLAVLAAAIGLSLAIVGGGSPAMAGAYYPDPCLASRSRLCSGLLEHWDLDEASNSTRWGAYGTPLLEPQPAVNIANRAGKIGSAADFTGSTSIYFWNSLFGSPGTRYYTIGFSGSTPIRPVRAVSGRPSSPGMPVTTGARTFGSTTRPAR
jgi:hypothetical protein